MRVVALQAHLLDAAHGQRGETPVRIAAARPESASEASSIPGAIHSLLLSDSRNRGDFKGVERFFLLKFIFVIQLTPS
jgi:hypothetical protein